MFRWSLRRPQLASSRNPYPASPVSLQPSSFVSANHGLRTKMQFREQEASRNETTTRSGPVITAGVSRPTPYARSHSPLGLDLESGSISQSFRHRRCDSHANGGLVRYSFSLLRRRGQSMADLCARVCSAATGHALPTCVPLDIDASDAVVEVTVYEGTPSLFAAKRASRA